MALSAETQKWLDDLKTTGGLTDEAFNAIKVSIEANPNADKFVKESALRQADYSRVMGEVQATRTALQQKEADVTRFQGELGTWKQGAETKFNNAVSEREAAQRKADAALARLRSLALANGLDEAEVLKDLDVTPNPNPNPNPNGGQPNGGIDTSKFLTVEQLNEQVRRATQESALVDASIYDIAQQHKALFGADLPSAANLVTEAIKAGKSLSAYWEEKFNVPAKRTEVAEQKVNDRVKSAVDEALAKERSEAALRGGPHQGAPNQPLSPVFQPNVVKPLAADHQGGGGISAALAAHAAGRYKGGVVHQS